MGMRQATAIGSRLQVLSRMPTQVQVFYSTLRRAVEKTDNIISASLTPTPSHLLCEWRLEKKEVCYHIVVVVVQGHVSALGQ